MNPKNKLYMIIYFSSMFTILIQYYGFCILCLFKLNTIRLSEWYTKFVPPHRLVFCSVIIHCDKKMNYVSFVIVTVYRQALWPDGLFISLYILVSLIDYLYLFIIYWCVSMSDTVAECNLKSTSVKNKL